MERVVVQNTREEVPLKVPLQAFSILCVCLVLNACFFRVGGGTLAQSPREKLMSLIGAVAAITAVGTLLMNMVSS